MVRRSAFQDFIERKTREAERASILPLRTIEDRSSGRPLHPIGNLWTRVHYDGDFHVVEPLPERPSVSMVFVQSRDRNTGAENPEDLGGGATDKHLIYEGLSRVAADAVLAGATTAAGPDVFFSVWHPELVSLRCSLGLPRHPAQMVISKDGRVDLNALLFNVPDVPVFLLATAEAQRACGSALVQRPWITVVPLDRRGLVETFANLRRDHGISRISLIGGRTTATAMVDAGLVQDVCLTTTARGGGEPDTPFYSGKQPPSLDLIVKKESTGASTPIVVEQLALSS